MVGATIFTQVCCTDGLRQQLPFLRKVVFASELRVEFKEEIEEENKSRQRLAQAIKEKKEKAKVQR